MQNFCQKIKLQLWHISSTWCALRLVRCRLLTDDAGGEERVVARYLDPVHRCRRRLWQKAAAQAGDVGGRLRNVEVDDVRQHVIGCDWVLCPVRTRLVPVCITAQKQTSQQYMYVPIEPNAYQQFYFLCCQAACVDLGGKSIYILNCLPKSHTGRPLVVAIFVVQSQQNELVVLYNWSSTVPEPPRL